MGKKIICAAAYALLRIEEPHHSCMVTAPWKAYAEPERACSQTLNSSTAEIPTQHSRLASGFYNSRDFVVVIIAASLSRLVFETQYGKFPTLKDEHEKGTQIR